MSLRHWPLRAGDTVRRSDTDRVGTVVEVLHSYQAIVQWRNGDEEMVPLSCSPTHQLRLTSKPSHIQVLGDEK